MNAALLYEHSDGRRRVAFSAESATFTVDDPSWWRAGPVELPPQHATAIEHRLDELMRRCREEHHEPTYADLLAVRGVQ